MDVPEPGTEPTLLRHAGALRALARGLLGEEHAAEDAVQDTWVRALEQPPTKSEGRFGGWLRSVTRSVALNQRRSDARRAHRERVVSRPERAASTSELVEKRQVLKSVIDAVLELEEPYQTVVVLRYYEDLPPREIAARCGVPVATVKSQLHRGLARLRLQLDEQAGGERTQWASALAVTVGWSAVPVGPGGASSGNGSAGGAPLPKRDSMMIAKTIVAAGAATFLTVAGVRWATEPEAEGTDVAQTARAEFASVADSPVAQPASLESPEPAAVARRSEAVVAVADEVSQAEKPLGEQSYLLSGIILDEDDLPCSDARVYVAPMQHPLNYVMETQDDGAFEARWQGAPGRMEIVFAVQRGNAWSGLQRIELEAGVERSLQLMVANQGNQLVRRFNEKVEVVAQKRRIERGLLYGDVKEMEIELNPRAAALPDEYLRVFKNRPTLNGYFQWPTHEATSPANELSFGELVEFEHEMRDVQKMHERESFLVEIKQRAHKRQLEIQKNGATIQGVVRDAAGEPVSGAGLEVVTPEGRIETRTSADGSYEVTTTQAGAVHRLRFGGGDHGIARAELVPSLDAVTVHDVVLDRGAEVRGRLLAPDGTPLADWLVELVVERDTALVHDQTVTDDEGAFALPNAPGGAMRLFARPASTWVPFPTIAFDDIRAGGSELQLEVPAGAQATGSLRLGVESPGGGAHAVTEVALWHEDSGRGIWMPSTTEDGVHAIAGLPAGTYRVSLGAPHHGYRDLGQVWIDEGELDLGPQRLDAAVAVELPEPLTDPAVLLRLGAATSFVGVWEREDAPTDFLLPAGDYAWQE